MTAVRLPSDCRPTPVIGQATTAVRPYKGRQSPDGSDEGAADAAAPDGSGEPLVSAPRPLPAPAARDGDDVPDQHLLCRHRDGCLSIAARSGWSSFACTGCAAYERPPAGELIEECARLAALGLWLATHTVESVSGYVKPVRTGEAVP